MSALIGRKKTTISKVKRFKERGITFSYAAYRLSRVDLEM